MVTDFTTMIYGPNDSSYAFGPNYDSEKYVEFDENVSDINLFTLEEGMFAIFFPGELHLSGKAVKSFDFIHNYTSIF
jgi:beta-galactosidase beta subunit